MTEQKQPTESPPIVIIKHDSLEEFRSAYADEAAAGPSPTGNEGHFSRESSNDVPRDSRHLPFGGRRGGAQKDRGRGRGRGRGGFRGGRGGFRGGRDGDGAHIGQGAGTSEDQSGDVDSDQTFRYRAIDKIACFQGPTFDLPPIDMSEKPFNRRNRLYLGNIADEVNEDVLTELLKPFGATTNFFMNKEKHFGFINMDFHANAEKAIRELDGMLLEGKFLKIRFAPNITSIKVKNLPNFVTNELLHFSFSPFGEIEEVWVCADGRGKSTGEGYVHFAHKFSAMAAVKKCSEGCYFLTSSLQPVIVELYNAVDDTNGYSDKNINKKTRDFMSEREQPPRFAFPGSIEFEFGQKWKNLYEIFQQKEEALKKELQLEKEKLIAQIEDASYERETELLREKLRIREMDRERQKSEWEMKEKKVEEERKRQEDHMRQQQEQMDAKMMANQENMRKMQEENRLYLQAHNLNRLLDQTEQSYDQNQSVADLGSKPFRFEGPDTQKETGLKTRGGTKRYWVRCDWRGGRDHENKRRRF